MSYKCEYDNKAGCENCTYGDKSNKKMCAICESYTRCPLKHGCSFPKWKENCAKCGFSAKKREVTMMEYTAIKAGSDRQKSETEGVIDMGLDCSKKEVFFSEYKRMCKKYSINPNECPMKKIGGVTACGVVIGGRTGYGVVCSEFVNGSPEKAIKIVQEWLDQNPVKTRADVFLEAFPYAPTRNRGGITIPKVCVNDIFGEGTGDCAKAYCNCIECWNIPVEKWFNFYL